MDDKIILICATGRSGSTTMQRIINTMPNTNICGENYGAINSLLEFYRRLKTTTIDFVPGHMTPFTYDYLIRKHVKPCWYNSYNLNQMIHMIKMMIINMFKKEEANIWGFKEIRYDSGNINYIKDFKELFPQTKVIIQIKENLAAQSKSAWFKDDPNSLHFLKKTSNELINFAFTNKEWCYLISFEQMFNTNRIQNLFQFLDCEQMFDENKIKEVLDNNLESYRGIT